MQRSTSHGSRYNIINHEGPIKETKTVMRRDPTAEMNIVSNLLGRDHAVAPILYDEDYCRTKFIPKIQFPQNAMIPRRREFNIVSNNFYEGDEAKKSLEFEKIQDEVTKRYWETHGYNPVVGQFYSDADEKRYEEQRKLLQSVQGKSQACRIPPRYCYIFKDCV